MTDVYGNWSFSMKFFSRNSDGSMPTSYAAFCTRRSIMYEASVTRNEHRYATPPGALFVYAPSATTCAAGRSYEPVTMWNSPALNLDGCASAKNAPLSDSSLTRRPSIVPSFFRASSPCMWKSRAKPVEIRFSVRSSIHFTGRPISSDAAVATT